MKIKDIAQLDIEVLTQDYLSDSIRDQLNLITGDIKEFEESNADAETAEGRKLIKSKAMQLGKAAAAFKKAGLSATEYYRDHVKAANKMRDDAVKEIRRLQAKVKAPLLEWEAKDKKIKDAKLAKLAKIKIVNFI